MRSSCEVCHRRPCLSVYFQADCTLDVSLHLQVPIARQHSSRLLTRIQFSHCLRPALTPEICYAASYIVISVFSRRSCRSFNTGSPCLSSLVVYWDASVRVAISATAKLTVDLGRFSYPRSSARDSTRSNVRSRAFQRGHLLEWNVHFTSRNVERELQKSPLFPAANGKVDTKMDALSSN